MIQQVHQDLRARFGTIRDQGSRPTCLAFAASDTHAALRTPWNPLSCEYAFFYAQKRSNLPLTEGTTLPAIIETLEQDGQPSEAEWPYSNSLTSPWNPPAAVSTLFHCTGTPTNHLLDEIINELNRAQPVLILTMLSPSFFSGASNGVIDPPATEAPEPTQRHALVAVGHGETQTQRALLIRNSWGTHWADNGYAWLTEGFLTNRLFAAATFTI